MYLSVMTIRLSKIVLTGGLAVWVGLVALGNITDYGSNLRTVQSVMAMDKVSPDTTLRWRAVTDPTAQHAAFAAIIVGQALTALAFLTAATLMAANLQADSIRFKRSKAWTAVGVGLGFIVWFVGFAVIASEWFLMWQAGRSTIQIKAFLFTITIVLVGLYVLLDNDRDPQEEP